ncbi:MAG: 4Fe-4S dicluster domain-containing protein [Clostridium sp.]
MFILKAKDLRKALDTWSELFKVFAPLSQDGEVQLVPYEGKFMMNYINFNMPFKKFLFDQKEELFSWKKIGDRIETYKPEVDESKKLYFGVRPCDLYSVPYLDLFFQERYKDDVYAEKRPYAYIVGLNCVQPGESCFCKKMGVGPFAERGYDVLLTPMNDTYLVEFEGEKGQEIIDSIKDLLTVADESYVEKKEDTRKHVEEKFTLDIDLDMIEEVMQHTFDNPIWKQHANHCIQCTGCTTVCPTCTCFNVIDEDHDNEGSRFRCWDSCQTSSFTRNAGDHNPRDPVAQVRYRILDKMKYIPERYGYKGCTGCGRCIDVCPAFIDIVETVNKIQEDYKDGITHKLNGIDHYVNEGEEFHHPIHIEERKHHHINGKCEDVYIPDIAIIKEIIDETRDIKRFVLQFEDITVHERLHELIADKAIGQFYEITIFGVGEIAISIPFGDFKKDTFEFYVKRVGKVTKALHNMKVGDKLGLRGPFGKGFPHQENYGKDIIVIGSGVGLAPVRCPLERIMDKEERSKFGRVIFIVSGGSYSGLIFKEDLKKFPEMGVEVMYALGKPTDEVDAHVGRINDLLPGLGLDWKNTAAIVCASPSRIKAVAKDLMELGMDGTDILTSLETHMRCGIGKCGHCKVGNKYMCIDGPVFNYNEMIELPPEF